MACEELYDVFWTDIGAYSKPRHVLCGVLAFVREPELCLSVAEAIFLCALLLFLSFTVYCAVLFVFWRTVPLWKLTDQEANSIGDGENDKDTSTLFVSSNQRVHNFQERVARQNLHVTARSNQSNESNVRARRIACACWPALVSI